MRSASPPASAEVRNSEPLYVPSWREACSTYRPNSTRTLTSGLLDAACMVKRVSIGSEICVPWTTCVSRSGI